MPRILVGAMVGINLAISGAILQSIPNNPLADPGIMGILAGARLTARIMTLEDNVCNGSLVSFP